MHRGACECMRTSSWPEEVISRENIATISVICFLLQVKLQ